MKQTSKGSVQPPSRSQWEPFQPRATWALHACLSLMTGGFPSTSTFSEGCLPVGSKSRRQGCRAILGLAHPQGTCSCCCCCFEDQKVTPSGDPYLPYPTDCLGFPCFCSLSTKKTQAPRHFACLPLLNWVRGTEEALRRDSATRGSMSQLPPEGPSEMAAADGLCPICLDDLGNAIYVEVCQHHFCFI